MNGVHRLGDDGIDRHLAEFGTGVGRIAANSVRMGRAIGADQLRGEGHRQRSVREPGMRTDLVARMAMVVSHCVNQAVGTA